MQLWKKLIMFALIPILVIGSAQAARDWLSFNGQRTQTSDLRVLENSWSGVEIQIDLPGLYLQNRDTKQGPFVELNFADPAFEGEIGSPRLPVLRKIVEVPLGAEVLVSYDAALEETADLSLPLIPVQPPVPKLPGALEAAPFIMDSSIYQQNQFLGGELVRIQDDDIMRGTRLVVLEISPVSYNPATQQIRYTNSINIHLDFLHPDRELTLERAARFYSRAYEEILNRITINHDASRNFPYPPPVPISYLIIAPDQYQNSLTPLVEWKKMCGYDVVIETAPAGATTAIIKNIILNAYTTWTNPPVYVLLAGDTDTIPCYTGEASGSADDNAYTELEGTGYWTPDVMIGRYPVRSTTDIETILAKQLQFEHMNMPSQDYFKDSVWLASTDHASMLEATHIWCFNNHILPVDPANNTMHQVFERLGGDTADFAANVNAGRGFVCYSGHGYGDGSGTASVHFVHSDVSALTNTDKYGHVMVFACGTNLHNQNISFGERWLIEANKGSVSYWGTSDSSYWTEDDNEQREIYRCQNEDAVTTLSGMYMTGLIYVYTTGGDSDYYFDIYNLMGDPSMDFVTRIPQAVTIDCPDATTPSEQDFNVTVTVGGSPREGALVAVNMNGQMLGAAYTDASGIATVHFIPPAPGDAVIQVSGHNLIEEQKPLMVMAAGCGAVVLDRTMYNCDQTILMRLWDSDLNVNPGAVDTAQVEISSDSETVPEVVTLTETDVDTGEFSGTIMTSASQSGPGYLQLAHEDEILLVYHDANCEGVPVDVTDSATADCNGPMISGVTISDLGVDTVTVSWTTDEASTTVLTWGDEVPPTTVTEIAAMTTDHSITLNDLDTCTEYFFKVSSVDAGGNVAEDDNGGSYYNFTTLQLLIMLEADMDSNPGWTYQGEWAWGDPAGSGGDPQEGYTGSNVVGYNLNGAYDDDMPVYYATTQSFDCSGASQAYLTFWKWLGIESASYDHATVEVSGDNGSTWDTVWSHSGGSTTPSAWEYVEYDISEFAANQDQVQIRWGMGPTDGSMTYCGWNIDDVQVTYTTPCNVPVLVHDSHDIDDSAGNSDGQINAGEQISLAVTLENNGLDATGIHSTLTTTNPHITITTPSADYPDIPQSGTGTSLTDYVFQVSSEATDGEIIPFTLAWYSNETSGSTSFSAMIVAPTLVFDSVTILDEFGDNDGILDPGESVQLAVDLANTGNGMAYCVSANLTSNQAAYVTINDSDADFGDIPGGSSGSSASPHFTITVSDMIPDPTTITFTLDIAAAGYTTSDTFMIDATASSFARRYQWPMDTNPNWTVEGQWAFGQPQGSGGDPASGYTGTNVYGYNLAGAYENSMPERALTTGAIDCSNLSSVEVRFMRWLGVESATYDHAYFRLSTDGSTWITIWSHTGSTLVETSWQPMTYDISAYADGQNTVYLRWVMGTTDGSLTYCGWNVDDVEIWAETSGPQPPTSTPTNTAIPPTYTPIPPTNTPASPTHTPVPPTSTPVPPTNTPVPPTHTPVPPTNTPVPPTSTPIPPTNTPVPPTYTAVPPTSTAVPPTATVVPPTSTPEQPTATPTEGPDEIVLELQLSQEMFHAGELFKLDCIGINPGPAIDLQEWILLDISGMYWFAPGWTTEPQYKMAGLPAYDQMIDPVLEFEWPEGDFGRMEHLRFWGAFLDPATQVLVGQYDMVEFGFE